MNPAWSKFYDKSIFAKFCLGNFDWDLIKDFPQRTDFSPEETQKIQEISQQLTTLIQTLDPLTVARTGKIPDEFFSKLRKTDWVRLYMEKKDGGPGLSRMSMFQLLCQALEQSIGVGFTIAVNNAFGLGSLLNILPEGPTRDVVIQHLKNGDISGWADTEPTGAAHRQPFTTATLTPEGDAYLINGEKSYIGDGPVADVLIVSASVTENGTVLGKTFVVDTRVPGFSVKICHSLMGLKGFPIGTVQFENVRVPKDCMISTSEKDLKDALLVEPVVALGRIFSLASTSLTIGKKCLPWIRYFCAHRKINHKPLADYDEIQRNIATTAAEIFALEAIVDWCLIDSEGEKFLERWWEIYILKNISTLSITQVVDRTLSLLGAFGYETDESSEVIKKMTPSLEQLYRDVRGIRISGGVDFLVEYGSGMKWLNAFYYNPNFNHAQVVTPSPIGTCLDKRLNERNNAHLVFVRNHVIEFYETVTKITQAYPRLEDLGSNQRWVITLNHMVRELMMMAITLAKAATLASQGNTEASDLADVYSIQSRNQILSLKTQIEDEILNQKSRSDLYSRVSARTLF